ncbi:hypothetical protein [Sodalis glossinidius]|uniref:hypothetical protein n=1 Tax=Sodalis glossinidius TaxID=63612 RepID=UPI00138A2466|nr:hypothetical protein [Sodalis glossinidius]
MPAELCEPLWELWPAGPFMPLKSSVFIDFLGEALGEAAVAHQAATKTGSDATSRLVNGEMTFDRDAAAKAIEERIARPQGLTVEDAASGVTTLRRHAGGEGGDPGDI